MVECCNFRKATEKYTRKHKGGLMFCEIDIRLQIYVGSNKFCTNFLGPL